MELVLIATILNLLIFVGLIVGVVCLQIYLSKKENKWYGLILPILSFMFSLLVVLGSTAMFSQGSGTITTYDQDGNIISEEIIQHETVIHEPDIGNAIFTASVAFLLQNIPTAILLVIYFASRENIKKRSGLDKMNIQDLG